MADNSYITADAGTGGKKINVGLVIRLRPLWIFPIRRIIPGIPIQVLAAGVADWVSV